MNKTTLTTVLDNESEEYNDMKKKLLCALLLTVFTLCSCQLSGEEEFLDDFSKGSDMKIDLSGYQCSIIQSYDLEHPFQYPLDTLLSDLYLARLNDISKDWNCNVFLSPSSGSGGYLEFTINMIYGGLHVAEIACTHQPSNLVRAGVLHPLDVLRDYLDYMDSSKFGSLGMLEMGMLNGVPYTVSPIAWPGKQASYAYNIFAVNENLISRYGKTDPRDFVENGNWTWATFSDILPEYQINDGSFSATAMNATWMFTLEAAFMNGADYIAVDDAGRPYSALDSVNITEALDWVSSLFTEKADCISFLGHYEMVDAFINGTVVLAQTSFTHMINEMIYDVDNYGVVPFPCGPRGTYGQWRSAFSDFDSMGIYVNANEPEAAAMIIDRMFEPFEGYETLSDIEGYAYNIFYDRRDVELFTTYLQYARWNYWTVGVTDFFSNAKSLAIKGASSAEIISRYKESTDVKIEQYVFPNYEFIALYEDNNE